MLKVPCTMTNISSYHLLNPPTWQSFDCIATGLLAVHVNPAVAFHLIVVCDKCFFPNYMLVEL